MKEHDQKRPPVYTLKHAVGDSIIAGHFRPLRPQAKKSVINIAQLAADLDGPPRLASVLNRRASAAAAGTASPARGSLTLEGAGRRASQSRSSIMGRGSIRVSLGLGGAKPRSPRRLRESIEVAVPLLVSVAFPSGSGGLRVMWFCRRSVICGPFLPSVFVDLDDSNLKARERW